MLEDAPKLPGIAIDPDLAAKFAEFDQEASKADSRETLLSEALATFSTLDAQGRINYVTQLIEIIYDGEDLIGRLHNFYRNFIETGGLPHAPLPKDAIAQGFLIRSSPEDYEVTLDEEQTKRINSELALVDSLVAGSEADTLGDIVEHFIYGQAMFYEYLKDEIKKKYNDILQ